MNFSEMIKKKMAEEDKGEKKLVKPASKLFYKPNQKTKCSKCAEKKLRRSPVVKRKKPRLPRLKDAII